MRIHLLSDLHLEFGPYTPTSVECDVIVLAGDIWPPSRGNPGRAVRWAREAFPGLPVVQVAGNHDYYGGALGATTEKLRGAGKEYGVHFLECEEVTIDGWRFLGCSLWTDYALFGAPQEGMLVAEREMNDYRRIRVTPGYARLRPVNLLAVHKRSVEWIRKCLECDPTVPTVVVTHTAPSRRSLNSAEAEVPVSTAYVSDLEDLMEVGNLRLWLHGHTHYPVDYHIGYTRVVSNPRGYADSPLAGFNPELVLEVV